MHGYSRQSSSDDPSERSRKRLMITVALGVIAAAGLLGFWQLRSEQPTVHPPAVALPVSDGYTMLCKGCRSSFEIKRDQFESWPRTDQGYKCPKCGSSNTTPDNSKVTPIVEVPDGG